MNSSSLFFFIRREQVTAKWLIRFHCFHDNFLSVWRRSQRRGDSWGNEYLYNAHSCVNLSTLQFKQENDDINKVVGEYCFEWEVNSRRVPPDQIQNQPMLQLLPFAFFEFLIEISFTRISLVYSNCPTITLSRSRFSSFHVDEM